MVELTLDGSPAGQCADDDFALATEYLRDGLRPVQVVKLLRASHIEPAITIVVNAQARLDGRRHVA
jgi:hypothetical protein